ncbi:hypothetical protein [Schaalia sp. lx-260]|uniref:hypothetical protein n=1 Tax=Schaalia sp. lx-260 TaxID=2899082 RepID=UPI001E5E96A0|nr:hypothetical protein [Schaalia sp. lx-260]MCD4549704.1 hypothetical protein [Schaalia sp. lx-260]
MSVAFYWVNEPSAYCEDHRNAALKALLQAADGEDNRLANPYQRAFARAAFMARLEELSHGLLKPYEEVKALSRPTCPLFEVRWQHIRVRVRKDSGQFTHAEIPIRMIFAEPVELSNAALGLHAHEKLVFENDEAQTRSRQNAEIDHAAAIYEGGKTNWWGLNLYL